MNQESFQLSVFSCQYFFRAEKTDFRPPTFSAHGTKQLRINSGDYSKRL